MLKRYRLYNPGASLLHLLGYDLGWLLFRPFATIFWGLRVFGANRIPKTGPVIVIANHNSYLDPPLMGAIAKRHMYYVARSTLFGNPIFKRLCHVFNAIPIKQGESDTAAMRLIIGHLKQQRIVLIYPEGARSYDGKIGEFQPGFMLLLKKSKAPVVPLAVEGVFGVWPRTASKPKMIGAGPIYAEFGQPITAESLLAMPRTEAMELLRTKVETMRLDLCDKINK